MKKQTYGGTLRISIFMCQEDTHNLSHSHHSLYVITDLCMSLFSKIWQIVLKTFENACCA